MAKEILAIPEGSLVEVIKVIRNGLKHSKVSNETRRNLKQWCDEEEDYIKGGRNG